MNVVFRTRGCMGLLAGWLLLTASTSIAADPRGLVLTLASAPPTAGVVSTRSRDDLQLRTLSGQEVALTRSEGRDYQLQGRGGFFWTQVQEVPMNGESVSLTPTLQEDGSVVVQVSVASKDGTRTQRFNTTIVAQPGEWVPLLDSGEAPSRSTTVYGTQKASEESLYLRVEY